MGIKTSSSFRFCISSSVQGIIKVVVMKLIVPFWLLGLGISAVSALDHAG